MCGIAGYLDKSGDETAPVGRILLQMLRALGLRGPDSAGMALFGPESEGWIFRIKVGETCADPATVERIVAEAGAVAEVQGQRVIGPTLRLSLAASLPVTEVAALAKRLEALPAAEPIEIVSGGRSLEIAKQVGSPDDLDRTYDVSSFRGALGIGHTRLSTESKVDLSHSQPFWAHGVPDVAAVHNGHITNYDRLRRLYEQKGVRFYTHNDSEVIGIYLRDRLSRGESLEEAMEASTRDFDGSFCYLVAAPGFLGFAKDRFGFKPLVVAETDAWVAVATEEVALRAALGGGFRAWEPPPGRLMIWKRNTLAVAA